MRLPKWAKKKFQSASGYSNADLIIKSSRQCLPVPGNTLELVFMAWRVKKESHCLKTMEDFNLVKIFSRQWWLW